VEIPSSFAPGEKYQLMSLAGGKHEKGKETRENMRKWKIKQTKAERQLTNGK
jgi:hypothetical protein